MLWGRSRVRHKRHYSANSAALNWSHQFMSQICPLHLPPAREASSFQVPPEQLPSALIRELRDDVDIQWRLEGPQVRRVPE